MDSEDVHRTPTAARRSNGMRPFVSPPHRGPAGAAKPGGIARTPTPAKPFAPRKGRALDALSGLKPLDGSVVPAYTSGSNAVSDAWSPLTDATEPLAGAIQPAPIPGLGAASPAEEEPQQASPGELEDALQATELAEPQFGAPHTDAESVALGALSDDESESDLLHLGDDDDPDDSTSPVHEHSGMSVLGAPPSAASTPFDGDPGAVASFEVEGVVEMMPEAELLSANVSRSTPRGNDSLEVLHEEPPIVELGSPARDGDSMEEVVARSLERVAGRVRSGSLEIPKVQLPSDEESALIAALSALRSSLGP
ncbi:MAG: hypothetical protein ABR543_00600 [Gemmatimonadaceae bacterium]